MSSKSLTITYLGRDDDLVEVEAGAPASAQSRLTEYIELDRESLLASLDSYATLCNEIKIESECKGLDLDEIEFQLQISSSGKVGIIVCEAQVSVGATINLKYKLGVKNEIC